MNRRDRDLRFFAIGEIGCIVCKNRNLGFVPCERHHLLTTGLHGNGKRRGDEATVGLCQYHHRGIGTPRRRLFGIAFRTSLNKLCHAFRARTGLGRNEIGEGLLHTFPQHHPPQLFRQRSPQPLHYLGNSPRGPSDRRHFLPRS